MRQLIYVTVVYHTKCLCTNVTVSNRNGSSNYGKSNTITFHEGERMRAFPRGRGTIDISIHVGSTPHNVTCVREQVGSEIHRILYIVNSVLSFH